MRTVCAGIVLSLMTVVMSPQVPVKKYDAFKNDPSFKHYIDGVGTGLLIANVELLRRRKPALYCQPSKLPMSAETYLSILDRQVKARESDVPADTPLETLLLDGLMQTFPCEHPKARSKKD